MDVDLSNYSLGLPVAASTYASRVDNSLHLIHAAMVAIFALWGLFFIYCLVRFRRRPEFKPGSTVKSVAASFVPDAVVLAFEIWLIFFYGLPIWSHIKENFPAESASNVVDVVAEQFTWGFQYPGPDGVFGKRSPDKVSYGNRLGLEDSDAAAADDIVTRNELHVPLGKPTVLRMSSKDVIHSFFVPEFRTKQDVVPGLLTRIWFEPTKAGRYEIGCAQLCGTGHYAMRGVVVVETPEEHEQWLAGQTAAKAQTAASPALDW